LVLAPAARPLELLLVVVLLLVVRGVEREMKPFWGFRALVN